MPFADDLSTDRIEYLPDERVRPTDDQQLRNLLALCFTKPQDRGFRYRRYWQQLPQHRWVYRDAAGRIIAHLAIHEKQLGTPTDELLVAGVAEVCTDPAHRQQGLARQLLAAAHAWMPTRRFDFAMLFGESRYYAGSGYRSIANPIRRWVGSHRMWVTGPMPLAMIRTVTATHWPAGTIDLHGPEF